MSILLVIADIRLHIRLVNSRSLFAGCDNLVDLFTQVMYTRNSILHVLHHLLMTASDM